MNQVKSTRTDIIMKRKGNLLSFAIGKIWQPLLQEDFRHRLLSLTSDGCPNLSCQIDECWEDTGVEVTAVK